MLLVEPDATRIVAELDVPERVRMHAREVLEKGYTIVRRGVPKSLCTEAIEAFRGLERANEGIFSAHRDADGHYPRIVNLHRVLPRLLALFTRNAVWLQVQDLLFGARTALYTSLFYETGSQQPLHRDTPVFCTRPELGYFGTTIYLEASDDGNGCLEVMEGGHLIAEPDREALALRRYPTLADVPDFDQDLWNDYQRDVVERGKALGLPVKRLHAEAGDSLIWHPQLPHGGSPIRDRSRTRFSFVMHTTPEDTPVYHFPVFFQPTKPFPTRASWNYRTVDGRKIAEPTRVVSFGHIRNYEPEEFARAA